MRKTLNTWLADWLVSSGICTRMQLAKELRISRSAVSHWIGRHKRIPLDKLVRIDRIYPINLRAYRHITRIELDEELFYD